MELTPQGVWNTDVSNGLFAPLLVESTAASCERKRHGLWTRAEKLRFGRL